MRLLRHTLWPHAPAGLGRHQRTSLALLLFVRAGRLLWQGFAGGSPPFVVRLSVPRHAGRALEILWFERVQAVHLVLGNFSYAIRKSANCAKAIVDHAVLVLFADRTD